MIIYLVILNQVYYTKYIELDSIIFTRVFLPFVTFPNVLLIE